MPPLILYATSVEVFALAPLTTSRRRCPPALHVVATSYDTHTHRPDHSAPAPPQRTQITSQPNTYATQHLHAPSRFTAPPNPPRRSPASLHFAPAPLAMRCNAQAGQTPRPLTTPKTAVRRPPHHSVDKACDRSHVAVRRCGSQLERVAFDRSPCRGRRVDSLARRPVPAPILLPLARQVGFPPRTPKPDLLPLPACLPACRVARRCRGLGRSLR